MPSRRVPFPVPAGEGERRPAGAGSRRLSSGIIGRRRSSHDDHAHLHPSHGSAAGEGAAAVVAEEAPEPEQERAGAEAEAASRQVSVGDPTDGEAG